MILFASKTDIQTWVQSDKILVDDTNSQKANIEATRIVKGQLAGFFSPIVISSWADPASTPELVRGVTGRLAAAFMYASIYSEEAGGDVSDYAQWLYNGAMALLIQITSGQLTVTDEDNNPVDTQGSGLLSFFPDDTTTPAFTMGDFFA